MAVMQEAVLNRESPLFPAVRKFVDSLRSLTVRLVSVSQLAEPISVEVPKPLLSLTQTQVNVTRAMFDELAKVQRNKIPNTRFIL